MPSFSSLFTSLTGAGFFYEKNSRHVSYNFNQEGQSLYRNQPRFPFEYYINIRLNDVGTASTYIDQYFNNPAWTQVQPLVKTIEMPSFKIETTPLNQYNRKRLSQTKIGSYAIVVEKYLHILITCDFVNRFNFPIYKLLKIHPEIFLILIPEPPLFCLYLHQKNVPITEFV